MIIDTTTKSIELVLAGAVTTNELRVFVSFIRGVLPQSLVRQSQASISNGTTDVTILSAPSAKESKTVTFVSVFNADTVNATVTIKFDDAATEKVIVTITLVAGDTLIFTEEEGFKVIDKDGGIKGSSTTAFSVPTGDVDIGDSAAEGASGAHSRADHQHGHPAPATGYPVDVADTEADGAATTPARSDHRHAHGISTLANAHAHVDTSGRTANDHHSQAHAAADHNGATLPGTADEVLGPHFLEGEEIADPAAPATNKGRLYFKDNGAGKTQLVVRFPTGAVQVIATEP